MKILQKWLKPASLTQGQKKELQARAWLEQQQIEIIAQNFHCRGGEIDLIGVTKARKQSPARLIFFEVKYRKNSHFGHPAEFVTPQKQQRLLLCAQTFLLKNPKLADFPMQFDVITFEGEQKSPEWIENAFGA